MGMAEPHRLGVLQGSLGDTCAASLDIVSLFFFSPLDLNGDWCSPFSFPFSRALFSLYILPTLSTHQLTEESVNLSTRQPFKPALRRFLFSLVVFFFFFRFPLLQNLVVS